MVVGHHRRHAIHFNVTAHPTVEWTARQVAEAFPWDNAPGYLFCELTIGIVVLPTESSFLVGTPRQGAIDHQVEETCGAGRWRKLDRT